MIRKLREYPSSRVDMEATIMPIKVAPVIWPVLVNKVIIPCPSARSEDCTSLSMIYRKADPCNIADPKPIKMPAV